MASRRVSGESTSDLYIRLGLSIADLDSGFVDAQRTIRDNMSRLWRENTIIDLQARVDLTGLDDTADAARILTIRTQALNQQIKIQRDRVRLASAELLNMETRTGATSDQTQRARIALEHHRLELARLEDQLQHLNDTQDNNTASLGDFGEAFDNIARQCWNFIGIAEVVGGALTDLIDHFRELQTQAYELNMPVNDVENFLRTMRLAGGDIGDFEGYIRGITDAYVKGEFDDPEFLALDKFGAKITDATGRLKNFEEITEEVYQAYLKAKEAGEEIEFLQLTGGEAGVRDAIQYFERLAEAKEDASKIFDAGLDPDELHEADRALNLLTEQLSEFKDAAVNVIVPKATDTLKYFFEIIRGGSEFLVENKDVLQHFTEPILGVVALGEKAFEIRQMMLGAADAQQDLSEAIESTAVSWADFRKETETQLPDSNPLSQYALKRIKDFRDELAELRIEIDYADNEYQQALAKLDLWKKNELTDKLFVSDDERLAIEELYSAKLEQIEQERADKIESIREKSAASERTALENKLAAIEEAKDEWISIGMEESEALQLAEKEKNDAILALEQEFEEARASIGQTGLEKALARIEKEKQAWIQKGIDEVAATEWAEQAKIDAQRNAALNALKSQIKEMHAFFESGYGGLQEYYKQQLYQSGVTPKDLQITPQQLQDYQQAQQMAMKSLLPNFMSEAEKTTNEALERNWAESYRDKVKTMRGVAIGDDGKIWALTEGTPHHYPYNEKGELDKDRAYQLSSDARLEEYFGNKRYQEGLEGVNIDDASESISKALSDALAQNIDEASEALEQELQTATEGMSEYTQSLAEVTERTADFAAKLQDIEFPANSSDNLANQPITNNITNQITIQEAHAWDREHIQELAEEVADIITPALKEALGGDSNAY